MSVAATSNASNSEMSDIKLKRNSDDVGWGYGKLCNAMNQDKWKCIKCGKEYSGGVYRIKQHIAGIKGNNSSIPMASIEDRRRCKEAIEGGQKKKSIKKEDVEALRREIEIQELDENEIIVGGGVGNKRSRPLVPMDKYVSQIMEKYVSETNVDDTFPMTRQQSIHHISNERSHQVHQYLVRWVYETGIAFNTVDNDSFKRFVEAVGQFGPGYQPPSQDQLRETLLNEEVERTKTFRKTQEEG